MHDIEEGGGRIIGEVCHFVDLIRHLANSPIKKLDLLSMADKKICPDTFTINLEFLNGFF